VIKIQSGKGSGELVRPAESVYDDLVDLDDLGLDGDSVVFLDALTNGGEKGSGEQVIRKALDWCAANDKVLMVVVQSEREDHDKLLRWYLSTGHFEQARTLRNTRLQYVLVEKGLYK
jgi:hypothetical protein